MEIKRRQSNFAQFSKDLYITVDHDHISIDVDIDQSELRQFSLMLLDITDDALNKIDADTDDIQSQIIDAMNRI